MIRERLGDWRLAWHTAIRESRGAKWVQIPTEVALESYETYKHKYSQQSVFAGALPMDV
jgi:hypothetical protein